MKKGWNDTYTTTEHIGFPVCHTRQDQVEIFGLVLVSPNPIGHIEKQITKTIELFKGNEFDLVVADCFEQEFFGGLVDGISNGLFV